MAVAFVKKDANSSDARSANNSGSLGSVIIVSSYSLLLSRVAGMFVFSRSCRSAIGKVEVCDLFQLGI